MIENLIEQMFNKSINSARDTDKEKKEVVFKLPIEYLSNKVENFRLHANFS